MTLTLRVKNWQKFQHYKRRTPPWIKLHRGLLDDIEWYTLNPVAAKMLVSLWLIASEKDGELPETPAIAFRLRLASTEVENALALLGHWLEPINTGLRHDASATLAPRKHDDSNTLLQRRGEERQRRGRGEAESNPAPVENKTPPETGKEPKNNPTLSDLAAQVQSCRPEFARLNTDSILNLLRNVPLPIARRAVAEFCRDELNSLKVPDRPLKLLGGYIRTARTAPQFTGAHNVSYDVQRQNDIRLARQEYEAMKNPYGRTPDQAKTEQARIVSAIAAKYGPAAAAAVTA